MKRLLIASVLFLAPALAAASAGDVHLEKANIDLHDQASLQRGAKYFVNYCMGCHSLKYLRYNRMAEDIGLSEVDVRQYLMFTDAKVGDLMTNSMRPQDGEKWFGTAVPDLTLVTRWRKPDWLYTYLKSFYLDESRPYGVNNVVFPDVGMPHVLGGVQGLQKAVFQEGHDAGGNPVKIFERFELAEPGSMTPVEYDRMVRDLTAFLTYAGEPIRTERERLGIWVLLFIGVFFILAYALKREYWKDVH